MVEKLLKPAEFAEKQLIESILGAIYKPGDLLPPERRLAGEIGVTRPTLRETLQRLSRDGWITIRQGKPTKVTDYFNDGGLSILSSLARYGKNISTDMVSHLLEVRTTIFPDIAQKAISNFPEDILTYLKISRNLKDQPDAYAGYDWGLQMRMVKATQNPIFNMIFNDFAPLYGVLGEIYFQKEDARVSSLEYYTELINAMGQDIVNAKPIVEKIMRHTEKVWQEIR